MAENNMSVYTTAINTFPDLAKNYLFQVIIVPEEGTPLAQLFKSIGGTEQFMLRCKSASIPGMTFEGEFDTHYMGTKKSFPGKAKVDGEMTLKFDEFQDLITARMLHGWQNLIHNVSINEDGGDITDFGAQYAGGAISNYLKDYSAKIQVVVYDSTKKNRLPYGWVCYQCVPQNVAPMELDMEGSSKLQPNVTFHYNTFQMTDANSI